jgi:nucleoside 2-deoxyribosyltransferase
MQGYLVKPRPVRKVYVAGGDPDTVARAVDLLGELGLTLILAQRKQDGEATHWRALAELYNQNLSALLECDLCVAILNGDLRETADVCVEIGLAYANNIPVLGLCKSQELRASPMLVGMCRGDDHLAYTVEGLKALVIEHIKLTSAALEADKEATCASTAA